MLFACGSNGNYQLGLGHDDDAHDLQLVNVPWLTGDDMDVVGGGNFTVIRHQRYLYISGRFNDTTYEKFTRLTLDRDIELVSCGWEYITFLAHDQLIVVGKVDKTWPHSPKKSFQLNGGIQLLRSGPHHTIYMSSEGKLFGFGSNRHGQLDHQITHSSLIEPIPLNINLSIRDFCLGMKFSCFLTLTGSVYISSRTGLSKIDLGATPQYIGCSWKSVYVVLSDNKIYECNNSICKEIYTTSYKIVSLSTGSDHFVSQVQTSDATYSVIGYGWNEHGNLTQSGKCADGFNLILETKEKSKIFCGCATTFIFR